MKIMQVLLSLFIFSSLCTTLLGFDIGSIPSTSLRVPPLNVGINSFSRFGASIAYVGKFATTRNSVVTTSEIYAYGATNYSNPSGVTAAGPGAVYLFNFDYKLTSAINPIDAVYINFLSSGALTIANGDRFGASVATINDADGDGFPELAVGAPGTNSNAGAVYILFLGAPTQSSVEPSLLYVPSIKYVKRISSPTAGALFGSSLASRVSGSNSSSDLLVGAPGIVSGVQTVGAYFYYNGISSTSTSALTFASTSQLSQSQLIGSSLADKGFGLSVVNIGDVNRDGFNDFAFGLPSNSPSFTVNATGTVSISLMGAGLTAFRTTSYPTSATNIPSLGTGSRFGASLGNAGDFNRDGTPDFIVGAPGNANGDGAAFILILNSDGTVGDMASISCTYLTDCNTQSALGSAVYYRENDSSVPYTYLLMIGGSRKSNGGSTLQGEVWLANINLPSPSSSPSRSATPSMTPSPSISVSATASRSSFASISPSPLPTVPPILPFLWNEKCYRLRDSANCGIGIGPGYYPDENNYV